MPTLYYLYIIHTIIYTLYYRPYTSYILLHMDYNIIYIMLWLEINVFIIPKRVCASKATDVTALSSIIASMPMLIFKTPVKNCLSLINP